LVGSVVAFAGRVALGVRGKGGQLETFRACAALAAARNVARLGFGRPLTPYTPVCQGDGLGWSKAWKMNSPRTVGWQEAIEIACL
jgi:hypothetical protein